MFLNIFNVKGKQINLSGKTENQIQNIIRKKATQSPYIQYCQQFHGKILKNQPRQQIVTVNEDNNNIIEIRENELDNQPSQEYVEKINSLHQVGNSNCQQPMSYLLSSENGYAQHNKYVSDVQQELYPSSIFDQQKNLINAEFMTQIKFKTIKYNRELLKLYNKQLLLLRKQKNLETNDLENQFFPKIDNEEPLSQACPEKAKILVSNNNYVTKPEDAEHSPRQGKEQMLLKTQLLQKKINQQLFRTASKRRLTQNQNSAGPQNMQNSEVLQKKCSNGHITAIQNTMQTIQKDQTPLQESKEKCLLLKFFRYHLVQFLQILGKRESYFEQLAQKQPIRTVTSSSTVKKSVVASKQFQLLLIKLKKCAATKGKYKYREKFNCLHSQQLRSMNYDVKKQLQYLRELRAKKQKNQPDDSDSEDSEEDGSPQMKSAKGSAQPQQITDLYKWKIKNGYDASTRVYIVKGGYYVLKDELDKRGWVENPDYFSPCFDLKFTTKMCDIYYDGLKDWQIANHFQFNECLTSKYGLCKNLRTLVYPDGIDVDTFYPRCYDLADLSQFEDWLEDYKYTRCEAFLKSFMQKVDKLDKISEQMDLRVRLAANVCVRRHKDFYQLIDNANNDIYPLLSPEEYQIIWNDELDLYQSDIELYHKMMKSLNASYQTNASPKKQKYQMKCPEKKVADIQTNKNQDRQSPSKKYAKYPEMYSEKTRSPDKSFDKSQSQDKANEGSAANGEAQPTTKTNAYNICLEMSENFVPHAKLHSTQSTSALKQELKDLALSALKTAEQNDPQFRINGQKNIWILKPNFLSRGRGIRLFDQFGKIMDYILSKEQGYVIQKYLENPLLINKKKFDIRQWVLVQDFNPPRVWFFDECYVRFSATDYNENDICNIFIHLTNNSIQKYNKKQKTAELMWTQEQLANYLKEINRGEDVFFTKIQPIMKHIVIQSLRSGLDQMGGRRNTSEIFGYDFIIDDQMNPWLLEINSSPTMEHSTKITARLCTQMLQDYVRVVIDYSWAKQGCKKNVNTGMLKLIYKGDSQYVKNSPPPVGIFGSSNQGLDQGSSAKNE